MWKISLPAKFTQSCIIGRCYHHPSKPSRSPNRKEVPFQIADYPVIGYDRDSGLGLYNHKLYQHQTSAGYYGRPMTRRIFYRSTCEEDLESHLIAADVDTMMQRLPKFGCRRRTLSVIHITWLLLWKTNIWFRHKLVCQIYQKIPVWPPNISFNFALLPLITVLWYGGYAISPINFANGLIRAGCLKFLHYIHTYLCSLFKFQYLIFDGQHPL